MYRYEVEFIDERTGQSFIAERVYDEEKEWQEIWDDFVKTGDLQMVPALVDCKWEDDDEPDDNCDCDSCKQDRKGSRNV
jgi:hypothetical protein